MSVSHGKPNQMSPVETEILLEDSHTIEERVKKQSCRKV